MTGGHNESFYSRGTKTYDKKIKAFSDVNLNIGKEVFGLLGPNGSGKTSLLGPNGSGKTSLLGPNGSGKTSLMRTIATLQEIENLKIYEEPT